MYAPRHENSLLCAFEIAEKSDTFCGGEQAKETYITHMFCTGNEFTTLDGFVFEWTVSAVTKKGQPVPSLTHKVIKLMKFEESHYKIPSSSLAEIESAGFHGSRALLFGIGTGQARVTVGLVQPQYESVKPAPAVILAVVANLVLDPQDTLLMPDTQVYIFVPHCSYVTL
jgi:hypothetical protein